MGMLIGMSNTITFSKTVADVPKRQNRDDVPLVILDQVPERHRKAMEATLQLILIAEAWNREDGFVPDYADPNQYKYFPWFAYSGAGAGFVFASTPYAASGTYTNIGSRLCFKTRERAEQFGKQFIDLWNEFLLP
jgi:hypothetical protein